MDHRMPESQNAKTTILLAEDERGLEFIAALLVKCGYNLITAKTGTEALQKSRDFDGVIDLLLSSIEMPGMTGIELATQLSLVRPDTKILLMSGLSSGVLVLNNSWQFLPKPFVSDMLLDRVRDFLNERPSEKQPSSASSR
jgi:DNA-binding response OmpR family regulator